MLPFAGNKLREKEEKPVLKLFRCTGVRVSAGGSCLGSFYSWLKGDAYLTHGYFT